MLLGVRGDLPTREHTPAFTDTQCVRGHTVNRPRGEYLQRWSRAGRTRNNPPPWPRRRSPRPRLDRACASAWPPTATTTASGSRSRPCACITPRSPTTSRSSSSTTIPTPRRRRRCRPSATGSRAIATSRSAATPAPRSATSSSARPTPTSSAASTPTCCSRRGRSQALGDWFAARPDSLDLVQGPMFHDDLTPGRAVTHLEPTWGAGMFGQWARDPRLDDPGCEPFQISMHGLGLFACRKHAWPGLNPRLRGFGAEEGYLHERVSPPRRAGPVPPAADVGAPVLTTPGHPVSEPLGGPDPQLPRRPGASSPGTPPPWRSTSSSCSARSSTWRR